MMNIPSADHSTVFVEIGLTALRNEDGSFCPAVPLFVQVPAAEITKSGQSHGEEELTDNISCVLAEKFGQYVQGIKALEHLRK